MRRRGAAAALAVLGQFGLLLGQKLVELGFGWRHGGEWWSVVFAESCSCKLSLLRVATDTAKSVNNKSADARKASTTGSNE